MKVTSVSVAVATLFAAVSGRNIEFPEPTDASDYSSDGFSPKPTLAAVDVHELFRREKSPFNPDPANPSNDYSYLVAPDNTCGYIGGRIGAGYTCLSSARCIFALTTAGGEGYLGCCLMDSVATTCGYRAGCINSADYNRTCTDAGCKADVSISKCTDPEYPYCATITFSEGVRDYYCNSIEISGGQLASTTYRGEDDEREFSLLTDLGTSKSVATKPSSSIPGPSPTIASTTSASPTNTDTGGGGGGGGGSKTPTGAIVGGVVGGVAAIGLVGLAVFFFLRNKKKKQASTNVPPPYQAPPMQQQPGNGPGGYNAVPQNQQTYYDPKHPYPSPNAQYVQPNSAVSGGFFPVQDPSQHPSSPTVTDPRMSVAPTSPSPSYGGYQTPQHTGFQQQQQPGFQPQQQNVIHEAPDTNVDSHRGQMHELA